MFAAPSSPQHERRKRSLKQYFDHETQDSMTALHLFCRSGARYDDIKTIVELQPQLVSHPTPNGGDTPLHFAVAAHDIDAIRLLLETHPAAANIKSRRSGNFGSQMTPLHVAILAKANFDIIKALVKASPRSLKIRDGNGQTPYQLAMDCCEGSNVERILSCLSP